MILESNHQTLYFVEKITSKGICFLNGQRKLSNNPFEAELFACQSDAETWGIRAGIGKFEVNKLEFNFRIQYQDGPIWQHQRFYRTQNAAEIGWKSYLEKIPFTSLRNHTWQLVDLTKGEVLASYKNNKTLQENINGTQKSN